MNPRPHKIILAQQRVDSGFYEDNQHVDDVTFDLLSEDLRRSRGTKPMHPGNGLPAAAQHSPPPRSGDSVARESAQRLAVAEPMRAVELPPVMLGPEGMYREADEIAREWRRFKDRSDAILTWLAVAFFIALCIGGFWVTA